MKAKAILLVSVLLVGCEASRQDANAQRYTQSLSAAAQGEAGKFIVPARWRDDGTSFAQDKNLWVTIRSELKMGIPVNNRIHEQKQKYLRNKSYLHDVILRAEPYMYWIAGQVKKRNMPMELVLLPIVESAFNPHATSGANAAGIWQIIPSTGRNYGLQQTRSYDARRDIVASTTAALDMMQRLNGMFNGDWLLTVAAYNSGEGRILRAIKANKSRGKPTDFWSLSLPRETRTYVPKMLALSDILKNNERYDFRLPTPDESRALARVRLNSPVNIKQLAEITGISVRELKTFNAGVKGSTVGVSGPSYVMVPQKHAAQLRESLASGEIAAMPADNRSRSHLNYKVRFGDTLSGIAARLGVSVSDLRQWNNLRGSGLKAGQNLVIGTNRGTARLADNNGSITYYVRKGDSLSSIARRHGVNIKDVIRWNDNTNLQLQPGDQLTLYVQNSNRPGS